MVSNFSSDAATFITGADIMWMWNEFFGIF